MLTCFTCLANPPTKYTDSHSLSAPQIPSSGKSNREPKEDEGEAAGMHHAGAPPPPPPRGGGGGGPWSCLARLE